MGYDIAYMAITTINDVYIYKWDILGITSWLKIEDF